MPSGPPDPTVATRADIERLERQISDLRTALDTHAKDLKMQFTRLAQLQADVDVIRARIRPPSEGPIYSGPERRRVPRHK
jgi:hypothetical protein